MYLSLGAERSLAEVGGEAGEEQGDDGEMVSAVGWAARIAAYSAHMALVERETPARRKRITR